MQETLLSQNLWKLRGLQWALGTLLPVSVIVLFYQEYGLTLQHAFILQAAFSVSLLIWEIPTGYLADRWGRKHCTIIGTVLTFLAFLVYALSSSFLGFLCAELLLGVATSFLSGTLEALTYDTLLSIKKETEYRRVIGYQNFARFAAESGGAIIGGLLATVSLRAPMWAMLIPTSVAVLLALSLEEAPYQHQERHPSGRELLRACKHALITHRPSRNVTLLYALLSTLGMSLFWFTQPYQEDIGLPLALFGITHAGIVFIGALAARSAHKVEQWLTDEAFIILIAALFLVSYIGLSLVTSLSGLAFLFLGRFAWGFVSPLISDLMNRMAPSHLRATILSARTFVWRGFFALVSPFLGYFADAYSLSAAFLLTGVIGAILTAFSLIALHPLWKKIPRSGEKTGIGSITPDSQVH